MTDLDIIPECYVDTNLVETLLAIGGHHTKGVNHHYGCNNVAKAMQDRYGDGFALGIIDDDKRKPTYLKEFKEVGKSEHLMLLKHGEKNHYIILVSRAVEDFILSCTDEETMLAHGFCNDLDALKVETKNVEVKTDPRFKKLFKAIKDAREMQIFRNVLSYLMAHKYDGKEKALRELFDVKEEQPRR